MKTSVWNSAFARSVRTVGLGMGFGFGFCLSMGLSTAQAAEISGIVYPLHDLTLSAGVGAVVLSKEVTLGQSVHALQLLLVLDDRQQVIEMERRRIVRDDHSEQEAEAKKSEIMEQLYTQTQQIFDSTGAISTDELLRLKSDYLTQKGRHAQLLAQKAREAVEYEAAAVDRDMRHVLAPVAGVITRLYVEPGEWAKPGDPLVHLVDVNTCYLKIAMPLQYASKVRAGMTVQLSLYEGGAVVKQKAEFTFVSPAADPASGLVEARISFDNAKLRIRPGTKGSVEIN